MNVQLIKKYESVNSLMCKDKNVFLRLLKVVVSIKLMTSRWSIADYDFISVASRIFKDFLNGSLLKHTCYVVHCVYTL